MGLALGTIRLPVLLLLGMDAPVAAGTNIFVSTVSAAGGSLGHLRARRINWRLVAIMGVPSVIGAFLGGLGSGRVPSTFLGGLAGLFVLWQGIEFIARRRLLTLSAPPAAQRFTPQRISAEGGIGFGIGLLGGAVGLILGSIRLPAIIRVLGIDARSAAATNLFIGFLLGLSGFTGHGLMGEVDVALAAAMGAAALVGGYLGARLTGKVRLDALILAIGIVLTVVGVVLLVTAVVGE